MSCDRWTARTPLWRAPRRPSSDPEAPRRSRGAVVTEWTEPPASTRHSRATVANDGRFTGVVHPFDPWRGSICMRHTPGRLFQISISPRGSGVPHRCARGRHEEPAASNRAERSGTTRHAVPLRYPLPVTRVRVFFVPPRPGPFRPP